MTEEDWAITLKVFDARGRGGSAWPGRRKFLEALHYFTVHNITWRALPAEFGNWNSVWKRFWRLSRAGCSRCFSSSSRNQPDGGGRANVRQHRGSCHVSAAGAKGRSKSGARSVERWIFVQDPSEDRLQRSANRIPPDRGEVSDSTQLVCSLEIGPDIRPRAALTDKGYDSKQPYRLPPAWYSAGHSVSLERQEQAQILSELLYKTRARIEQMIGKLKRFKRVALRCEKTKASFEAIVCFACIMILVKSVHMA